MIASWKPALALGLLVFAVSCGEWPGRSLTGPTAPTTASTTAPPTTATGTVTVAWSQDIAPILSADCTRCHSQLRTYAGTMVVVTPGNANSRLVTATRSNGSMYRYLSGNRTTKSDLIRRWVVENGAAESR